MNIVVSELLTHYSRAGSGKLVLILPGWADTSVTWRDVQHELSQNYDVVVLDLPGFGGSEMLAAAWGLEDYASFVAAFITKLGAGAPYAIIGHSNGGAIALKGLGTKLFDSNKLVLLASAGVRSQDTGRKQGLKLLAKTGKILSAPLPSTVKKRLRKQLYTAAGSDMLVAEHMQETFKQVVGCDIQADAAKVSRPTLLVYGSDDDDTPVRYGELLQRAIAGSQLKIIEGAGHFLFKDKQAEVIRAVKDFVA